MDREKLNLELNLQASTVRFAHSKYVIDKVTYTVSWLAIMVGLAALPEPAGAVIAIIALISTLTANKNVKDTYNQLQDEEKKLLKLERQLVTYRDHHGHHTKNLKQNQ